MPQIIIEYNLAHIDDDQLDRLAYTMAPLCAQLFSVEEWKIRPGEFGFKFEKIKWPSRSTHNMIVRIALHNFEQRMTASPEHAKQIRNHVLTILSSFGHLEGTTVGVALSYLPIEWAEGMIAYREL